MKQDFLARPVNTLDAARWDDAISSIWFYLLGPGYKSKDSDTSTKTYSTDTAEQTLECLAVHRQSDL